MGMTYEKTIKIDYWYDVNDRLLPMTDELRAALGEEANRRAQEMMAQGCVAGELNCLWKLDHEIRGWWKAC